MPSKTVSTMPSQNAAYLTVPEFRQRRRWSLWSCGVVGLVFLYICYTVLAAAPIPLIVYYHDSQIRHHLATIDASVTKKTVVGSPDSVYDVSYQFTVDGRVYRKTVPVDATEFGGIRHSIQVKYDSTNPANSTHSSLLASLRSAIFDSLLMPGIILLLFGGSGILLWYTFIVAWRSKIQQHPFDPASPVVAVPAGKYPTYSYPAIIGGMAYSHDLGTIEFKSGYLSFSVKDAMVFRLAYTQIDYVRFHTNGALTIRSGDNSYGISLGGLSSISILLGRLYNLPFYRGNIYADLENTVVVSSYDLMRALRPLVVVKGKPHNHNSRVAMAILLMLFNQVFIMIELAEPTGPVMPVVIVIIFVIYGAALWLLVTWFRINRQLQRHGLRLDAAAGVNPVN